MTRKIRKGGALAAACMLLFLAAIPGVVRGAVAIDTGKEDCSMTFSLSSNDGFEELDRLPVTVALYQVAEVTESGVWQPAGAYESIGLKQVDSGTTAAQWGQMAKEAAEIAAPGILDENGRIYASALPDHGTAPDRTLTVEGVQDTKTEGLGTGMYLVLALAVDSAEYRYSFAPYLVAVPGNAYEDGENGADGDVSDAWIYDVDVTLKPDRIERFGSLEITKNLSSYRAGSAASFLFQIEATKMVDGTETSVYSDVAELSFDAPGSKSLRIENRIPAGAIVKVTEIYKGADYEVSGDGVQVAEIRADGTAAAVFTNTWNGQLNGGSSIVNNFQPVIAADQNGEEVVENWRWTQQ